MSNDEPITSADLLLAAQNALKSYEYGNASPDLAREIAEKIGAHLVASLAAPAAQPATGRQARILGRYAAINDVPLARECANFAESLRDSIKAAKAFQAGEDVSTDAPSAERAADLFERVAIELTKLPAADRPALADAPPNLSDIEQYRMQMAAISTASFGYWTEVDGIKPEYDTVALRDVAKLYVKYEAQHNLRQALADALRRRLRGAVEEIMSCQLSGTRLAMTALQELVDAAHEAAEGAPQAEPAQEPSDEEIFEQATRYFLGMNNTIGAPLFEFSRPGLVAFARAVRAWPNTGGADHG